MHLIVTEGSILHNGEDYDNKIGLSTVHAHPTMHESIHEAVLATENRAIHQ